jgi:hypothetical protein
MGKEYIISQEYFERLLDENSRRLVGKVLKRYEICPNPSILKSEIKELIYENYREMKNVVEAHQQGYEQKVWTFKQKEGK